MIVYLKYNKGIKRITDVCLRDCSRPQCHNVSEERIDPALWYKVLVLDSLLVDCDTRRVFWTSEKLPEASYLHKCHEGELQGGGVLDFFKDRENIFQEGECYDYDPTIDELFDTATKVFRELSTESLDHDSTATAYENLLKMLHVFILPRIKFVQKDRASVEVVLKWIEKYHENIEDQIQKKDKTKRNTENSLHEQRKHLLEDGKFSKASYVATCDPDFLNVFLPHLEKFIRKCNEELIVFDQEITPIRNSATMADIKRLKDLRCERDTLHATVQKAMTAREEIKNIISRKHVKKKLKKPKRAQSGSFQLMYVEIAKRLQDINTEIQDLIKIKIKISSVREAVLLTLNEIDTDRFSYGYNCKKGSLQSEMDIFDPSHKPEQWITLREKVKLHLQIKQAGFRSEHEKFCQRINLQCQQLYDESKMFAPECAHSGTNILDSSYTDSVDRGDSVTSEETERKEPLSPRSQLLDVIGNQSKQRRSRQFSYDEMKPVSKPAVTKSNGYTSRWSVGTVSKEKCQSICEDIINHIQDMAYRLALELTPGNVEPQRFYVNKVYVCYEEHVSIEVMPILNDLYERSYLDHCQGLCAWLQKVPVSEVCGGDMKILRIIQSSGDSANSSEESSREASSDMDHQTEVKVPLDGMATIGSRNMHEMSLEELYHIYEEQCKHMPATFPAVGDIGADQSAEENSSNSDDNGDHNTPQDDNGDNNTPQDDNGDNNTQDCNQKDDNGDNNTPQASFLPLSASKDTDNGRKEACASVKQDENVSESQGMPTRSGANNSEISDDLPASLDRPRSATQGANGRKISATCEPNIGLQPPQATQGANRRKSSVTSEPNEVAQPPPYNEVVLRKPSFCPPPPAYTTLPPMAENFYQEFSDFKRFIQEEDEECTLFGKLRKMTGIIRYIESTLTRLRREAGAKAAVSADDLVDVIIFLLCKLDAGLLLKLYAHLNLMIHLSPRFMEGNAHEYSLVTLNVAYQHLFEQSVMQSVTQQ